MTTPTPEVPHQEHARISLHRNRTRGLTTWWVSIDGRTYLRQDYPTRAAARQAAAALLTAHTSQPQEGTR
jgi:hypothetical protein